MILAPFDVSQPLLKAVEPSGWHNLRGPMAWYTWSRGDDGQLVRPHEDPELGWVQPIHVLDGKAPLAALVRSLDETGQLPKQAYLWAGAGGIGKTTLTELIARSLLTRDLRLCQYEVTVGDVKRTITLVDEVTGKPFRINPPPMSEASAETVDQSFFVRRALAGHMTGNTIPVHMLSAGRSEVGVKQIDAFFESMRHPIGVHDQARVSVIEEIDAFTKAQTKAFKEGLDPRFLPTGNYVFAHTNHADQLVGIFDDAALQRFSTMIVFQKWDIKSLVGLGRDLARAVGITVAEGEVAKNSDNQEVEYTLTGLAHDIAIRADGAARRVVSVMEDLRASGKPLTRAQVLDAAAVLGEDRETETEAVDEFLATKNDNDVVRFVQKHGGKRTDFSSFLAALALAMIRTGGAVLVERDVAAAFLTLQNVRAVQTAPQVNWVSAAYALKVIGRAARDKAGRRS